MAQTDDLISLTANVIAAHVSNNSVAVGDLPALIRATFGAFASLGQAPAPAEPEKPKGAVSLRASIKPDYLVSMIDGKRYKLLRRHLGIHGYTPESYREAFGLPIDYPMVAPNYAEQRRTLAKAIGLGRKPGQRPVKKAKPSGSERTQK